MELAVLIEPLSCSIHAVERGRIEFGDVVVIAGAGPLGLGMVGRRCLKRPARSSCSTWTTSGSRSPGASERTLA